MLKSRSINSHSVVVILVQILQDPIQPFLQPQKAHLLILQHHQRDFVVVFIHGYQVLNQILPLLLIPGLDLGKTLPCLSNSLRVGLELAVSDIAQVDQIICAAQTFRSRMEES